VQADGKHKTDGSIQCHTRAISCSAQTSDKMFFVGHRCDTGVVVHVSDPSPALANRHLSRPRRPASVVFIRPTLLVRHEIRDHEHRHAISEVVSRGTTA
jgi:hypothetical protein